jgi:cytochrome c-type biogenesis protein CcmE
MHPRYKFRLYLIGFSLLGIGIAVGIALYALRQNIDLYYTPTQLLEKSPNPEQSIRLGGFVKPSSFKRNEKDPLKTTFVLSDESKEITVHYRGVLPALFREGQGIIVQGYFSGEQFRAKEVLAKHDEKYEPPDIQKKRPS